MLRRRLLLACSSFALGCAVHSAESGRASRESTLITRAEMDASQYLNAYDLIEAKRGVWLHQRGRSTIGGRAAEIQVLLDELRLGGVATLKTISLDGIRSIRFIDPVAASARWGLGYGEGAILVSSRDSL